MCGRYGLNEDPRQLAETFAAGNTAIREALMQSFDALDPPLAPRFNVPPTTRNVVIVPREDGVLEARWARWGLLPHWVKDPAAFRATLFNARSESAHEKPSFRDAFKRDRCIVPVSGFYEWRADPDGGPKQPHWIRRRDGAPMGLAGLHALNTAAEPRDSFTILTTRAGGLLRLLHDREPVRIPPALIPDWLDPERRDAASLSDFLEPGDPHDLEAIPVGTSVNRPGNDRPDLLTPVGAPIRVEST